LLLLGAVTGCGVALAAGEMPALEAGRWINSAPLSPQALRGKVVLIDIWEYTCINWIRTSPFVRAWNRDYGPLGLVVIGVHVPEFEFGKAPENIDRGIRDHGLAYPIAIDNDYAIWRALDNNAWPAKYLYDAQGRLVQSWIGEGSYNEIEMEIRRLLTSANPGVALPPVTAEAMAFSKAAQPSYDGVTPESYVGTLRRERGAFKLEGDWKSEREFVELRGGAGIIVLPFTAGEVNLVVQPGPGGKGALTVLLDGKPIGDARGGDVGADSVARFDRSGIVRLVARAARKKHVLTLVANDPGLRAYVFTFGP
jgi:hypothetical protein